MGPDGGARQLDHGADEIGDVDAGLADDFAGDGIDPRLDEIEFLAKADQRHHDFRDDRRAGRFRRLDGGLEDGAGLHFGNLGVGDRQPAAAMAEHRVEFVQLIDALA
jgi:hypothetical protein